VLSRQHSGESSAAAAAELDAPDDDGLSTLPSGGALANLPSYFMTALPALRCWSFGRKSDMYQHSQQPTARS